MDPITTPFERALHLLLFVSTGIAVGVVGIAALERLSAAEGSRRSIRLVHVAIAVLGFAAFFAAERIYHGVH